MEDFIVKGGESNFKALEGGTYLGICSAMISLGLQEQDYQGETRKTKRIMFVFTLPGETYEYEGETRCRTLMKEYTASIAPKAALKKDLESWRGRAFTDQELEAFELVNVLGKPVMLSLIAEEKNGKSYNKINGLAKIAKGMTVPEGIDTYLFSAAEPETYENWEKVPEWIQSKIKMQLEMPQQFRRYLGEKTAEEFPPVSDDDLPF